MTNSLEPPDVSPSPGQESLRQLSWGACRDFWRCLPDLLYFDLIFKVIAFLVLAPPIAWLFQRFISSSGAQAIGNFDIAHFLLRPAGAVTMLVLVALGMTLGLMELGGLVVIGCGALADRRVTYLEALQWIARRAGKLVLASLMLLGILALLLLPFVIVALVTANRLLGQHDINYYLSEHPPEFRKALAIGAVLVAVAAVVIAFVGVRLVFVFPELLVGQCSVATSFRRSWRVGRGQWRRVFAVVLGAYALWSLAGLLLTTILHLIFRQIVELTPASEYFLLPILGVAIAVAALVNLLVYFAGTAIICLAICRLYRDAHRGGDRPLTVFEQGYSSLGEGPRWRLSRKVPLIGALCVLLLGAAGVWGVVESTRFEDHVGNTAHRAGAKVAPENTLAAVDQALADGATYLEIDVQLTADGEIVVVHDADLMRLAGSPLVVADATYAELSEIDIGTRFDPRFADQRVATLDEFIDVVDRRAILIIELKCYGGDYEQLVREVARTVRERELYEHSVVMSLHYEELMALHEIDPQITIGFVVANALGKLTQLNVDFLAVKTNLASHALIGAAHAVDKEVYVWTVNDPDRMGQMIDRGVDNIITDDPAALSQVLRERESLSSTERLLLRFRSLYDVSH